MIYTNETFKNKTASVIGVGISNLPLIDYLLSHGAAVTARDLKQKEKLPHEAAELEKKGVKLVCGDNYLDNIHDEFIFRSPGVRYDKPQLLAAVAGGSVLTSEMELFFALTPAKIIGITGSDGKTTTTTVIYKMLESAGHRVYLGGNIGAPLLPRVEEMSTGDIAVVELSSFQLHTMDISPDTAVITNISPNHLDYHTSMEEYIAAKTNIFLHPRCRRLVLNYSNEITRSMAALARPETEVVFFMSEAGIYQKDGVIYYKDRPVLPLSDILLPGSHNAQNYMAAVAAAGPLIKDEDILKIAKNFGGVEHRCEFVREKNGVKFYNSSIDSSPTRTAAALNAFEKKVIVICGGYDKHIPFEPLAEPLCRKAKIVVLTGATGPKIKAALDAYEGKKPPIYECPDFYEAVITAAKAASPGDTVILSPACASFDAFPNFEVRGRRFKEIVRSL